MILTWYTKKVCNCYPAIVNILQFCLNSTIYQGVRCSHCWTFHAGVDCSAHFLIISKIVNSYVVCNFALRIHKSPLHFKISLGTLISYLTQPRRETNTSCPQWKFQNSNFIIFTWNLIYLNTIEEEIFLFPGCGKGENEVENLQLILTILF